MEVMEHAQLRTKPFQNSLSALAEVGMRETGSDGYAFFQKTAETYQLECRQAGGRAIAEDALGALNPGAANPLVATYALGTEGVLAFTFQDPARFSEVRRQLNRMAETIEAVWLAAQSVERYSQLANHVAHLETLLMDSKIADRTRGVLGTHRQDQIEAIARHVESVLRETPTRRLLQQISRELEEEVEERGLAGQAKAILQASKGMSEEEAHAHLRSASRKSRRRLKEVARDVIARHSSEVSVHD
jgi:AmiR/NasT family two-component response regulator